MTVRHPLRTDGGPDGHLSTTEVAERLGVSRNAVDLVRERIGYMRCGQRIWFAVEAVDRYLEMHGQRKAGILPAGLINRFEAAGILEIHVKRLPLFHDELASVRLPDGRLGYRHESVEALASSPTWTTTKQRAPRRRQTRADRVADRPYREPLATMPDALPERCVHAVGRDDVTPQGCSQCWSVRVQRTPVRAAADALAHHAWFRADELSVDVNPGAATPEAGDASEEHAA